MIKVLIIEDNKPLLENTAELLELEHFSVVTAGNGPLGLELARTEQPHVILCDILMPAMDGYEVLRRLKGNSFTAGIPFIFFTANAEPKDIAHGLALGASAYLTKPFDSQELTELIRRMTLKTIAERR